MSREDTNDLTVSHRSMCKLASLSRAVHCSSCRWLVWRQHKDMVTSFERTACHYARRHRDNESSSSFSFVVMVLYDVVTIHCVRIRVPVAKLQMCQYFCNYSCNDNLFSVALIRQNLQLILYPSKLMGIKHSTWPFVPGPTRICNYSCKTGIM